MKSYALRVSLILTGCLALSFSAGSFAAVTSEHRKQIDEVKKELGKVKAMIAKKDFDEAVKQLGDAEQKLKQVAKDDGIEESNKLVASLLKQVEQHRETITKKRAAGGGAGAFERDVAPILVARCLNCHGADNPRAN